MKNPNKEVQEVHEIAIRVGVQGLYEMGFKLDKITKIVSQIAVDEFVKKVKEGNYYVDSTDKESK